MVGWGVGSGLTPKCLQPPFTALVPALKQHEVRVSPP